MRRPADEVLEHRYRYLLGCYPAGYRAANAEEMLGVAMARWASAPGRRWPSPGEAASLLASGLGKRFGAAVSPDGLRDGLRDRAAWLDAAAVVTVIGPVLLAAAAARTITGPGAGSRSRCSRRWSPTRGAHGSARRSACCRGRR